MRIFSTAVQTLFPVEPDATPRPVARPSARRTSLLGQLTALACALAPLAVMVDAYIQTA